MMVVTKSIVDSTAQIRPGTPGCLMDHDNDATEYAQVRPTKVVLDKHNCQWCCNPESDAIAQREQNDSRRCWHQYHQSKHHDTHCETNQCWQHRTIAIGQKPGCEHTKQPEKSHQRKKIAGH